MANEVSLRLTIAVISNEIATLKEENIRLRECIKEMCMKESATIAVMPLRKQKWVFYHKHKASIRATHGLSTSEWRQVKRLSDALYYKHHP